MRLVKVGKIVYLEDESGRRKLRDLTVGDLDGMFVGVGPFGNLGRFLGYGATGRVVYMLEDSDSMGEARELLGQSFPIFPIVRMGWGPGTIDMFWKSKGNGKFLKMIVAAAQFHTDVDGKLVITHMAVRPKWRRNRVNTFLIDSIAERHPELELVFDDPTDMGKSFMRSRGIEINPFVWRRHR
jgi:hypothetical protein